MIIHDEKLQQQILDEYLRKERMRWHPIVECPFFDASMKYSLSKRDIENHNTSYFKGFILNHIDDDMDKNRWTEYGRAEKCRYFVIDNTTYDLRNPVELMSLPIPKIDFDEKWISIGMIDNFMETHPDIKEKLEADEEILLTPEAIEAIINRAALLSGRVFSEDDRKSLEEWFAFEDENISDSKLLEQLDFFDKINQIHTDEHDNGNGSNIVSSSDDGEDLYTFEDDLGKILIRLACDTYYQALNIPLTHIAINHAIAMRSEAEVIKNIIIQTVAVGNVEYGKWLINKMRSAFPDWNEEEIINEGLSKKEYKKNDIDYEWVYDYLPDIAPKNKSTFIQAQKANSEKYQNIVKEAAKLGYTLPVFDPEKLEQQELDALLALEDSEPLGVFIPYFNTHPPLSPMEEQSYCSLLDLYRNDLEAHSKIASRININSDILRKLKWTDNNRIEALYELAMTDIHNYYPKLVAFYDEVVKFYPGQEQYIKHVAFSSMVGYSVHRTAAIALDKAQQFEKLISFCDACIKIGLTDDGTKGGMQARLNKGKKKLGLL